MNIIIHNIMHVGIIKCVSTAPVCIAGVLPWLVCLAHLSDQGVQCTLPGVRSTLSE